MEKREGEETENGTTQEKGSICGFDSLYLLLQTSLSSQLFQEVNRILLGLNCGKKLESIALPQPVKALSANHDFDLQVATYISTSIASILGLLNSVLVGRKAG
ncbi:hypothetical protein H5410_051732 [Solanum commersonii]|uniref:Uncharacterized protein n=1 Tax=Solanum commersonii TaxID=4109 RepID=A0A9J5WYX3_SOLCO|nr:hypothetical protein H5410_051732 [Solanum commersonii]